MRISDWSSDVCSSDLRGGEIGGVGAEAAGARHALRAPGDMPLPADDAVDVGDHDEGEARQPVGLETLAEGDAGYRELGGAGARRPNVAETPVGECGARHVFRLRNVGMAAGLEIGVK